MYVYHSSAADVPKTNVHNAHVQNCYTNQSAWVCRHPQITQICVQKKLFAYKKLPLDGPTLKDNTVVTLRNERRK